MKKTWENNTEVYGKVFSVDKLKSSISKKNMPYISGNLSVAVNEDETDVIDVNFTYVPETYKKGNANASYTNLLKIMETMNEDPGATIFVRINGQIDVREFDAQDGKHVVNQMLSGRFVHIVPHMEAEDMKATFSEDMIITNVVDQQDVTGKDPAVVVKGFGIDKFREQAFPLTFYVKTKAGMDYFLDQDVSMKEPMVTNVWGNRVSTTVVQHKEVESAFGAPQVKETTFSAKSWDIEGAKSEPLLWDDDSTITKEEFAAYRQNYEQYLADEKKRQEEYRKTQEEKNNAFSAKTTTPKQTAPFEDDEDFNF